MSLGFKRLRTAYRHSVPKEVSGVCQSVLDAINIINTRKSVFCNENYSTDHTKKQSLEETQSRFKIY